MDDGRTRLGEEAKSPTCVYLSFCRPPRPRAPEAPSIQSILAAARHGAVVIDINGHVVAMNARAQAIFHCHTDAEWPPHFSSLIGEDYPRTYLSCLATGTFCESACGSCEGKPVLARLPDGHLFPITLCITQVKIQGDLFAVAHVRCEES